MRRKDREITDINQICQILNKCKVCRIAMVDKQNKPYVVPVNFGYTFENNKLTLYIHGVDEGKKIDIISSNPYVCIEMDCNHQLTSAQTICSYGYNYSSIIANGYAEILTNIEEKKKGLEIFMFSQTEKQFLFTDEMALNVSVIKIVVDNYSCKQRNI